MERFTILLKISYKKNHAKKHKITNDINKIFPSKLPWRCSAEFGFVVSSVVEDDSVGSL